jgi:hypothetical protein
VATLGSLYVTIGADLSDLKRGVADAKEELAGFGSDARQKLNEFGKALPVMALQAFVAASAAAAAATVYLTAKAMENVDAMAKMADAADEDIKAYKGMSLAAKLAGVEQQGFDQALQKYLRTLGEAQTGNVQAAASFQRLGLDAKKMAELTPSEQLNVIADKLAGIGDAGVRSAVAVDLFGREGAKMVNVLKDGSGWFDEAKKNAEALGTAVSRVDAAKIEQANDAVTMMQEAFHGVATTIAVQAAPYLEAVANWITKAAIESDGFKNVITTAFEWAVKAAGFFGDALRGIHILFKSLVLGAKVIAAALVMPFEFVGHVIVETINDWLTMFNTAIEKINGALGTHIGKIELLYNPIHKVGQAMRDDVVKSAIALDQLAGSELPSEKIKRFFDEIRNSATAAAEESVASAQTIGQVTEIIDVEAAERRAKEIETLNGQLTQLQAALNTEFEAEHRAYAARMQILGESLNQKLITQQTYDAMFERIEAQHQAKLTEIERKGLSQRAQLALSGWTGQAQILEEGLGNMSTLMRSESAATMEVGKAFAVAQITVASIRGAYEAYTSLAALGPGGMVAGAALAATIAAAGAHSINQVMQTRVSDAGTSAKASSNFPTRAGSSVPGPVADRTASPSGVNAPADGGTTTAAASGPRAIQITLQGRNYSRDDVADLIAAINDAAGDGVHVKVA